MITRKFAAKAYLYFIMAAPCLGGLAFNFWIGGWKLLGFNLLALALLPFVVWSVLWACKEASK